MSTQQANIQATSKGQNSEQKGASAGNNGFWELPKDPVSPPPVASGNESYARVVTKNGWKPPLQNKRKREKSGLKVLPPLKGVQQKRTRDIYIRGLATDDFKSPDDMEEAVKIYCSERGVLANFTRVVTNTYGSASVGCRVNVNEEDYETILDQEFWCIDVEVREWFPRGRERKPSRTFQGRRDDFDGQ